MNIRESDGCTALHWAADKGLVEMARALLQVAACDCNIKDNDDGYTPLIAAALLGHSGVVEELCRHPSIE
jgi:ankyrin repeat protein